MSRKVGVDDAAIHRQRLADRVIARPAGEIDRGAAHIQFVAHALARNALGALLLHIARNLVHVRRERAGGKAGDVDVIAHQPRRHTPRQVDQRGFRSLVAVGLQGAEL